MNREERAALLFDALRLVNAGREAVGAPPLAVFPNGTRLSFRESPIVHALWECSVREADDIAVDCIHGGLASQLAEAWGEVATPMTLIPGVEAIVQMPASLREFAHALRNGSFQEIERFGEVA